ncbi:YtzC family protein [Cytobacillus spongiae]|jgi:ElaB/YqjD/DUF883 family membrane-anchored ribosome-binding protein|uniref:YtzC family protein n=1 Tax=Cytobacillus spongiae TaxID=2901381 RepID=UPI001F218966|nr:YtzC family protein [Cytobacillus spongiae]UII55281.1 YtzC family protein [Cytobacillus spongiae]
MATRQSMEQLLEQCETALQHAQEQYKQSSRQEHYNDDEYAVAMQELENAYNDLTQLAHSANSQQREQLHRMRLQLQQAQNHMTLLRY